MLLQWAKMAETLTIETTLNQPMWTPTPTQPNFNTHAKTWKCKYKHWVICAIQLDTEETAVFFYHWSMPYTGEINNLEFPSGNEKPFM